MTGSRCLCPSRRGRAVGPGADEEGSSLKFVRGMVDLRRVGLLFALGLTVLFAAALLVWRSPTALVLATLLAAGAAAGWVAWADHQYRGVTSCPWDGHNAGHPVVVGLALSLGAAVITTGARWRRDSRGWAAILGLSAGVLAGVVILVVAFFFGAGLHCTD
jgi:hypothetical protein